MGEQFLAEDVQVQKGKTTAERLSMIILLFC